MSILMRQRHSSSCVMESLSNANCFTVEKLFVEFLINLYLDDLDPKINVYAVMYNRAHRPGRECHPSAPGRVFVPPKFNNTNSINWFATSIYNNTEREKPRERTQRILKSCQWCLMFAPVRYPL